MRCSRGFDEKQMMDRGTSYKYGFFTALFASFLIWGSQEIFEFRLEAGACGLMMIWIPLTVCVASFILKNAYDRIHENSGRCLFTVFGLAGLFMLGMRTVFLLNGRDVLMADGELTDVIGYMFVGGCMVALSLIYWGKQLWDRKHPAEE